MQKQSRWVKHVQGQRDKRDRTKVTYCRQHPVYRMRLERKIACGPSQH